MASIDMEKVSKIYPNGTRAVSDLTLDVRDGEFMVLVGPSGCGKTSALRMVAGLEDITSGTIRIGDRVVNRLSPKDRDVAMVFQNYALYPHMTVGENIGFALRVRRMNNREAKQRVLDAAHVLGLAEQLNQKPRHLSGGQRQRVAMGRVMVREPSAFLLDEPLSNLDAKLRVQMRAEISRIQRRLSVATLYVTHDQIEAMTMGDRVAVMRNGILQQCAAPQTVYDQPANLFVAAFIGSPAMNLYECALGTVDGGGGVVAAIGDQNLSLVEGSRRELTGYIGRRLIVGIRPEALSPATSEPPAGSALRVKVNLVEVLGPELLVHFGIDARRVFPDEEVLEVLSPEGELPALTAAEGFAKASTRTRIRPGDDLVLVVDGEQLHFFDPDTGLAIG
jgi:multiple sugar transport system ATP-binding protein